ncbi:MAG: hypothetical protein JW846_10860 [Dehalococcoidia bacterium]|nr:hypothetical protein [Dehalococcoidia bacterium]
MMKIDGVNNKALKTTPRILAITAGLDGSLRTAMAVMLGALNRILHWKEGRLGKKIVLLGALPAGIAFGYLFYLSIAAGFAISHFCGGEASGKRGRVRSLILPLRQYELHFHHWLLALVAATGSAIHGFSIGNPGVFYGLLSGLTFQGIYCYTDWHRILKRRALAPAYESVDVAGY